MDLSFSPEHEAFRREVVAFLESHRDQAPRPGGPSALAWQKLLIAHGSDVETVHAREIISRTNPEALEAHQPACDNTKTCAVGA